MVWMMILTAHSALFNLVQCVLLLSLIGEQLSLKRRPMNRESGFRAAIEFLTQGDVTDAHTGQEAQGSRSMKDCWLMSKPAPTPKAING
jgi:hypothetical protein